MLLTLQKPPNRYPIISLLTETNIGKKGALNCDLSDNEIIFLCINRPIAHPMPSSYMRRHILTKNLVNFISSQRFDFVTYT